MEISEKDDSVLLALERRLQEIKTRLRNLNDEENDGPHGERLCNEMTKAEKAIARAVAHTPAGLTVKIGQLKQDYEDAGASCPWHADSYRTALEALERMSGSSQRPAGEA